MQMMSELVWIEPNNAVTGDLMTAEGPDTSLTLTACSV